MRRIIKRLSKRDDRGRLHQESTQELLDDEAGTITDSTTHLHHACETCARPIEQPNQAVVCDRCQQPCCDRCVAPCAVCARRICPECRRGFPDRPIAVCPECLAALTERTERLERADRRKAAIEQLLALQREQIRVIEDGALRNAPLANIVGMIAEVRFLRNLRNLERGLRDDARNR